MDTQKKSMDKTTIGGIVKDYIIKPLAEAIYGDYNTINRLDKYMLAVNTENARKQLYFNQRNLYDLTEKLA